MVIITFQSGTDWYKANWVFRQFVSDLSKRFQTDTELVFLLQQADALGGLSLDKMEPDKVSRIMKAMDKVAEDTISGTILGWKQTKPEDKEGQEMYLRSISELLDLIRKEKGRN